MAATLLRVVSIVAFLQFVGHGTMFVRARPTHGPEEVAVVEAMRAQAFTGSTDSFFTAIAGQQGRAWTDRTVRAAYHADTRYRAGSAGASPAVVAHILTLTRECAHMVTSVTGPESLCQRARAPRVANAGPEHSEDCRQVMRLE